MGHGAFPKWFRSQGHSLANEDRASVRYRHQPPHTGVTIAIWGSANKLKTKTCGSRTCKPNFVCRTDPAGRSFLWAAHCCGALATYPEVVTHRAGTCSSRSQNSLPIWSCSVWGLPCPRHYCCGGALLPHLFTLTRMSPSGRYVFCGTFRRPGLNPASRTLSGTLLCGVRTFLSRCRERPSGPAANASL
jgi:hypothetical protein